MAVIFDRGLTVSGCTECYSQTINPSAIRLQSTWKLHSKLRVLLNVPLLLYCTILTTPLVFFVCLKQECTKEATFKPAPGLCVNICDAAGMAWILSWVARKPGFPLILFHELSPALASTQNCSPHSFLTFLGPTWAGTARACGCKPPGSFWHSICFWYIRCRACMHEAWSCHPVLLRKWAREGPAYLWFQGKTDGPCERGNGRSVVHKNAEWCLKYDALNGAASTETGHNTECWELYIDASQTIFSLPLGFDIGFTQ